MDNEDGKKKSHWSRGIDVVSAATTLKRGGRQKKDESYDPSTRIAPPPNPPISQESLYMPPGESASYFAGHPKNAFSTPSNAPPQHHMAFTSPQDYSQWNGSPPHQNYSPPPAAQNAYSGGSVNPHNGYPYHNQYQNTSPPPGTPANYTHSPPYNNFNPPPQPFHPQPHRSQTMYDNTQPPVLVQRSFTAPVSSRCPSCHAPIPP